jgi:carbon-monoxide dehydrogenase medium subunit
VVGNIMCGEPSAELPALFALLGGHAVVRGPDGLTRRPLLDVLAARRHRPAGGPTGRAWVQEVVVSRPVPGSRIAFAESGRRFAARAVAGAIALGTAGPDVRVVVFGVRNGPICIEVGADGGDLVARVRDGVLSRLDAQDDAQAPAEYRRMVAADLAAGCARRALAGGAD